MSSVVTPVAVSSTPVHLELRTSSGALHDVLRKLSATIASNAACLQELREEVRDLRGIVGRNESNARRTERHAEELRAALRAEFAQLAQRLSAVEQNAVFKPQLQEECAALWGAVAHARGFIDEIERGRGERVSRFVAGYIEEFVPRWYEGVAGTMWNRVEARVAASTEEAAATLESRAVAAEQHARELVAQTSAELSNMIVKSNDARRGETRQVQQFAEDQVQRLHAHTTSALAAIRAETAEQHAAHAERCSAIEGAAAALRATLFLDEATCRELCAGFGGAEHAPMQLPLEQAANDIRVQHVATTPHHALMRAALQKELAARIELLKVDLHQCFVQEIVDVQRELRGKIGAGKFGELLAQYRDHQLYAQVKALLSDAAELRNTKVDSVHFIDALRSKADMKAMDKLVDRSVLSSAVGSVSNRVEELEHVLLRLQERHDALHVANLRMQAALEHRHNHSGHHRQHSDDGSVAAAATSELFAGSAAPLPSTLSNSGARPAAQRRITSAPHTSIFGEGDGSSGIRSAAEVLRDTPSARAALRRLGGGGGGGGASPVVVVASGDLRDASVAPSASSSAASATAAAALQRRRGGSGGRSKVAASADAPAAPGGPTALPALHRGLTLTPRKPRELQQQQQQQEKTSEENSPRAGGVGFVPMTDAQTAYCAMLGVPAMAAAGGSRGSSFAPRGPPSFTEHLASRDAAAAAPLPTPAQSRRRVQLQDEATAGQQQQQQDVQQPRSVNAANSAE